MKERVSITLDAQLINNLNSMVDGVTIANRSQAIEYLVRKSINNLKVAVILCGGNSMKTENGIFRICAPFFGRTVIEYNIKGLRKSGFGKIYIAGDKLALIEVFKILGNGEAYGLSVEYIEDDPEPKGSMGTLAHVRKINQTFLVASGDVIFGETNIMSVWNAHLLYKGIATLHVQATTDEVEKMGVVTLEGNLVREFIEKPPTKKFLTHYSGFFIAEPEIFSQSGSSLERDVFPCLASRSLLYAHPTSEVIYHFHTKKELIEIEKIFKKSNSSK